MKNLKMFFKLSLILLLSVPLIYGVRPKLVEWAANQYSKLNHTLKSGIEYPADGIPTNDHWHVTPGVHGQWTAGFYPGVLWHLYNLTKDTKWEALAIKATDGMFQDQFRTDTHDIGFMIMCSYGKGLEFTKNSSYPKVIVNAAHSLAHRFNCKTN